MMKKIMETMSINDKQGLKICENVGQMLVDELGSEEVWKRVEAMINGYIKENNVNADAANFTDNIEWSVKVRLKK